MVTDKVYDVETDSSILIDEDELIEYLNSKKIKDLNIPIIGINRKYINKFEVIFWKI